MLAKTIILIFLSLAPFQLVAQQPQLPKIQNDRTAAEELESVIAEAGKLDDKLASINVRSRAAALVSLSDPVRSDGMFLEVWKLAKQQENKDFDKDQALTLILKFLFPRNPELAKRLLSEESRSDGSSLQSRATGRDSSLRRQAKLASQLIDGNPSAASALLERSLSMGVTPAGLGALLKLREKDPLLSDFVVAKALDGLKVQPTVVALPGLHLLTAYLFPGADTALSSIETDSSLQSLQFQYFSTTYDVLKTSLAESEAALVKDQHYTPADLRFRAIYQGQVAMILAALASRYQPSLLEELNGHAKRLSVQLPPNVAQLSQFTAARLSGSNQSLSESPETAIPLAISNGDFDGASKLIDDLKNEEMRKTYSQVLTKVQAKAFLANSDVLGALSMIRKVEDQTARLALYLEAVKAAQKTRDAPLSNLVVNEARTLIPQTDRNGLHVRALLSFAAQLTDLTSTDDAAEFLDNAVSAINSLPKKNDESAGTKSPNEVALDELNDPRSLLDAPEMERAFSSMGIADLERATSLAKRIDIKPVQLVARLEAIQGFLKSAARRSKPPTKSPKASASAPGQR